MEPKPETQKEEENKSGLEHIESFQAAPEEFYEKMKEKVDISRLFEEQYANVSFQDMENILNSFLQNQLSGEYQKKSHEEVYALLNRFFELTTQDGEDPHSFNYPRGYAMGHDLLEMFDVFDSHGQLSKEDHWKLDKAFSIIMDLSLKYPEKARILHQSTNSVYEFVSPEIFLDTYASVLQSPKARKYYSSTMFSQMEYNMSYCGTESYINALKKKFDFHDIENYSKISSLMEIVRSLYNYIHSGTYAQHYNVDENLERLVSNIVQQNEGSYFLNVRAQQILQEIKQGWQFRSEAYFKIQKKQFAVYKDGVLHTSDPNDYEEILLTEKEIDKLSEKLDKPPQELVDQAVARGESEVFWQPDIQLFRYRQSLYKKINEMCDHELCSDDFLVSNRSERQGKKTDIIDFGYMMMGPVRKQIETDFNIQMSQLSLPEQYQVLHFTKSKSASEMGSIRIFTKLYGKNGFRTFLSLEHGGKEMGDKILELGERLPQETAKKVFEKYAEMVDATYNVEEYIQNNFTQKSNIDVRRIKESIMVRGVSFLNNLYEETQNSQGNIDIQKSEQTLNNIHTETLLFASAIKEHLKEHKDISFEEIKETSLEIAPPEKLQEEDLQELERIYKENRKGQYPDELLKKLYQDFRETITDSDAELFILKNKDKIVAFMQFKMQENGNYYAGSLNTRGFETQSSGIGMAVFNKLLREKLKETNVEAVAYEHNPALDRYQKQFGFKIVGEIENYKDSGEKFYKLYHEKIGGVPEDLPV